MAKAREDCVRDRDRERALCLVQNLAFSEGWIKPNSRTQLPQSA